MILFPRDEDTSVKQLPQYRGILSALPALLLLLTMAPGAALGQEGMPEAVRIIAPDGLSTPIYSDPSASSRNAGLAFHGDIMEKLGEQDGFIEIPLPEGEGAGFVLKEHTETWEPPRPESSIPSWVIAAAAGLLVIIGIVIFLVMRSAKKTQAIQAHRAAISNSIRNAESHFKAGRYEEAAQEFQKYIKLQGEQMRTPDVYRRLTSCYKALEDYPAAAKAWDKMKSIGGLQTMEDYTLGVEIMMAMGEDSTAASIYEQLLSHETNPERIKEIRKKLFDTYRRIKEPGKLMEHAVALLEEGLPEEEILPPTVSFLIELGRTDMAIQAGNKPILMAVRDEFLDEKIKTREASKIYQKCLEFDRTDLDLHKMLAEIHKQEGNFKSAVMELTILQQLSKDDKTSHLEEAARIYVENGLVSEAIAEGNPAIIKKIAQIYLARSEVNPDAVSIYEKVLEIQPNAVGVNKMLRTVYLTKGELQKYMNSLWHLHEIDGANHDYLGELAQCVVDNNLVEQTMAEGNRDLNAKIIRKLLRKKAVDDESIGLFERLAGLEPRNLPIRKALAQAYEEKGDKNAAIKQWIEVANIKPGDEEALKRAVKGALAGKGHDVVLEKVEGKLLTIIAKGLIKKQSTSQSGLAIIDKAAKANPRDTDLSSYVSSKTVGGSAPRSASNQSQGKSKGYSLKKPVSQVEEDSLVVEEESLVIESHYEDEQDGPGGEDEEVMTLDDPFEPSPASSFSDEAGPLTTFVSASERDSAQSLLDEDGLFKPSSGGFIYKPLEEVFADGWGEWRYGKEVNTGRDCLMLVLNEGILKPDLMKDFVQGIGELGFNINHENVMSLEEITTGETGQYALVFNYLPDTLSSALNSKAGIDVNTGKNLVKKIVSAMAYAHNHRGKDGKIRRTFHLHLQPNYLFCSKDLSEVKIAALGFSQLYRNLTGAKQRRWEAPGMNPAYMPPEFFLGQKGVAVNEKSADIYSIGVLMYQILAGEAPFEGPDFEDYKMQHSKVFPAPPRLINQALESWLEPVILGCLEKAPEKRWSSVNDIEQALNRKST
jgi:tetratricopeptide (TPR) repeat protein